MAQTDGASVHERMDAMMRATALSQEQLGVARLYNTPKPGAAVGPLAGCDVLIKDLHQVAGEITTMGSVHQEFVPEHSDSTARALLNAGATLVGASVSAEFGTSAYTEPVGMDQPVNPLNLAMMTGGSSGGAAAAVARGLVQVAHASDGGGSIRIPAACCGLLGLKPAHDNSALGGFTSLAQGLLAENVDTTRRAYGLAPREATPVERLRVGYTNTGFHARPVVDPQVSAATAAAAGLLLTHPGVESVAQAPAPYSPSAFHVFEEFLAFRCATLPGQLSALTEWLRQRGRTIPAYHRDHLIRQIHALDPTKAWNELDVVATPTIACAPPPPGAFSALPPKLNFLAQTAWTPWGTLWNLKGWASVAVPLVDSAAVPGRWPISLMLGAVSDRVSESQLLDLAEHVMESTSDLPPEQLSIGEPGDIEALGYQPTPENRHEH